MCADTVKLISPHSEIREKIGNEVKLDEIFTAERIESGQSLIDQEKSKFITNTNGKLNDLIKDARLDSTSATARRRFMEAAFQHKGQAESLGYELFAKTLDSLARYSETHLPGDESARIIIGKHIDILEIVLRDKVMGDGDKTGQALLEALPALIEHFHPSGKK